VRRPKWAAGDDPGAPRLAREAYRMTSLLWLITIILFALWVLGFAVNWGAWIWFLLVVAVIALLINSISHISHRH
jgi:hypothetical protein